MPGVAINPTSLEVTEDSSESYTVVLTSEPTANRKTWRFPVLPGMSG